jgi:hypothetical protein
MEQLLKILGNAHKSPLTTILGVIMILASLVCVYHPTFAWGWDKAMPGLIIGFTLIFLPDPKNPSQTMGMLFFMLVFSLFMFGCRKPCSTIIETRTVIKDSIHIQVRTVNQVFTVPGQNVTKVVPSPCPEISKGTFKPKTYHKKEGNTEINAKQDSTGAIDIDCKCLGYQITIARQDSVINKYRQFITTVNQVLNEHKTTWYDWMCYGFTGIGILLIILSIILKVK